MDCKPWQVLESPYFDELRELCGPPGAHSTANAAIPATGALSSLRQQLSLPAGSSKTGLGRTGQHSGSASLARRGVRTPGTRVSMADGATEERVVLRGPRTRTGIHVGAATADVSCATGRMVYRGKVRERVVTLVDVSGTKTTCHFFLSSTPAWLAGLSGGIVLQVAMFCS